MLLKYLLFCKRRNIKRNEEKRGTFGEFFGKLLHRRSPVFYRAYCKRRCLVCDFAGGATTMTSGRASSPRDRVLHLSSRAIKRSKGEKSKCERYVCGKREAQVGYDAAFRWRCAVRPPMPNTTRACTKLFPHSVCEIIETQNLANPRFVRGERVALYVTCVYRPRIPSEFVYSKIKRIVVRRPYDKYNDKVERSLRATIETHIPTRHQLNRWFE